MKLTGTIGSLSIDVATGKAKVTLDINEKQELLNGYDDLKNKKLSLELKKYRKKRSLDANAYAWQLIDEIAKVLRVSKIEVYRNAIKEIGGVSDMVCVKSEAVDSLCKGWENHGIGWMTETISSKITGCTNVILYYGSSMYDTAQMSRLIDGIVSEANDMGIQTLSERELSLMKEDWRE